MSTFRNPVGPQPSKVYWRRRLMVLLGLAAVIVIVVLIIVRPGGGENAGADDTKKTAAETTPDAADTAAAGPVECNPSVLGLAAVSDKGEYQAGETPMISMTLTNNGAAACTMNAGTDVMELVVTSGPEQFWSSKDCQTDAAPAPITIEPGASLSTIPIAWDRTRSTPETCDAPDRPAVTAGGASYHLTVKLGEIESAKTKQFLLY
ncbi:hypothetical protein [Salinibacterium sp. ZJ454]|uniref:hypothetical protein n=1 Tax=Salinibacterium sp. ZJ454 TaxID=2708339 RepID=UPI00142426FA|nr:hypothetical protein [Salinibacterium sp. ZJ454]